ncbi:MAG: glycosyl hydrolase-related protein [Chloroflexi bacterium]|nr:glycosyl hydrolase-related protein [Chloroflexota bacterium]
MEKTRELFIVSHTHWDREWYRSFQQYRLQLLSVIDRLLELMAREPRFKHFILDGQTVMLEDYLALRPERTDTVRGLVRAGRLDIGPWYVQPDEFLVSGEALIRNLLFGEQTGAPLDGVVKVGWLPDTFGHVAQLPQILRNFGIKSLIFSRGLGDPVLSCPSAFWWRAPNGASVLALHQVGGYWNAGNLGHSCFWGDTHGDAPDPDRALQTIRDLLPALDPNGSLPALALWNGADHTPPQSELPRIIAYLNTHLGGYRVKHSSVQDYVSALSSGTTTLPTIQGELRGSRYQALPTAVLSTRVYLKKANHRAQRLLECYAEPLSALASALGSAYPAAELREAWRLLLHNHAHDSICGCGIDPVHREMTSRFDQVEQIGQGLVDRSVDAVADRVDTASCAPGQTPLLEFNCLARPRSEVTQVTVRLPELSKAFSVIDSEGREGVTQIVASRRETYDWIPGRTSAGQVAEMFGLWREYLSEMHRVDIRRHEWLRTGDQVELRLLVGDRRVRSDLAVEKLMEQAKQLPAETPVRLTVTSQAVDLVFQASVPALGYAVCRVEARADPGETPPSLARGERAIENEHLRVLVESDGSLTVRHKATSREFRGLHRFEDAGDAGDTYDFCPALRLGGPMLLSSAPAVALIEDGPLQAAMQIQCNFDVPEALAADRQTRSTRRVALPVTSIIRLRAGSPIVEITTTLENQARDHRLRLRFPTGISSEFVHADGHMAIVSRSVALPPGIDWAQPPTGLKHHRNWFSVDDDASGLAILSEGLHEHEALEEEGVTLALTLLRSVGWLSRGDLGNRTGHAGPALPTPDAQCLNSHCFRYGILPYPGRASRTYLPQLAAAFDVPLFGGPMPVHQGTLPPRQGFVSLEPDELVLSAIKKSETGDRLVVRFYNVSGSRVRGHIRFGFALAQVWQATAGEQPLRQMDLEAGGTGIEMQAEGNEIVTLLVCPGRPLSNA